MGYGKNPSPVARLHAIFFNSFESVQVLLDQNITRSAQVCCVEVMPDFKHKDRLIEDPNPIKLMNLGLSKSLNKMINSGSKKLKSIDATSASDAATATSAAASGDEAGEDGGTSGNEGTNNEEVTFDVSKKFFTVNEFVQFVYFKRIHRLTENMIVKKVNNWKDVCETFKKRIEYLLNPQSMMRDGKVMSLEDMKKRKSFAVNMQTDSNLIATLKDQTEHHSKSRNEPTDVMINIESRPGSTGEMKSGDMTVIKTSPDRNKTETTSSTAVPSSGTKSKTLKRQVSFAVNDSDNHAHGLSDFASSNANEEGEVSITKSFQTPYGIYPKYGHKHAINEDSEEKKTRSKYSILAKRNRFVIWKDQGLVYKIIGKPFVYPVNMQVAKQDINSWMVEGVTTESNSPSPSRPGTAATLSRASSRGSLKRQPSLRKTPSFAPLERLRSMSIRGLSLLSDPNDTPFANLPENFSRPGKTNANMDDEDEAFKKNNEIINALNTVRNEFANTNTSTNTSISATTTSNVTAKKYAVQEINVLGRKSFWLESRKIAMQEKLQIMEEVYKKEQETYHKTEFKDGRVKRYPRKRDTLEARRMKFIDFLKNRIESKFDAMDKDH